jgi:hypothetical protein
VSTTASRRWAAAWLTSIVRAVNGGRSRPAVLVAAIQRARRSGVDNLEIAATLEESIELHPLTITGARGRRSGRAIPGRAMTLDDLLCSSDD